MVSRPVWEINPGDFHGDTLGMTQAEVGAYMLLLMSYWRVGSLPDDDAIIRRISRSDNRHWKRIKKRLQPLFYDGWKHKRMEADLAKLAAYRARQSANACGKRGPQGSATVAVPLTWVNPLKTNNPTPATAPYSLKKTKLNSFFGTVQPTETGVAVDRSLSADRPPKPNKFQNAWMAALASQLEPHVYAEAIGLLLADEETRDRITAMEIREKGSGVMGATIAYKRLREVAS